MKYLSIILLLLGAALTGSAQETHVISVAINQGVDCPEALSNDMQSHFKVYPNPASDHVKITFPEDDILEILLYELSGKLSLHRFPLSQDVTLQTANLRKGIYILKIVTRTKTIHKKISIENGQ
ncbi:MAG: T9SS type A sorting domain-containing protein [Cyclobacteriaceae bacterium]